MKCHITFIMLLGLLIGNTFGQLRAVLPIYALPHSGIVGAFDNFGAAIANFGNGRGSGYNALLSGTSNGMGTLFSGLFGSGAVNTGFLNYNNRPPVDPSAAAPALQAGGADAGPAKADPDPPPEPDSR